MRISMMQLFQAEANAIKQGKRIDGYQVLDSSSGVTKDSPPYRTADTKAGSTTDHKGLLHWLAGWPDTDTWVPDWPTDNVAQIGFEIGGEIVDASTFLS